MKCFGDGHIMYYCMLFSVFCPCYKNNYSLLYVFHANDVHHSAKNLGHTITCVCMPDMDFIQVPSPSILLVVCPSKHFISLPYWFSLALFGLHLTMKICARDLPCQN